MADELCVPFSAVNDCLNALVGGGYLEIVEFKASRNRRGYTYALTSRGLAYRLELAASFIERRWQDYEAISQELRQLLHEFADAVPQGRRETVVPVPMHRSSPDKRPERAVRKASVGSLPRCVSPSGG